MTTPQPPPSSGDEREDQAAIAGAAAAAIIAEATVTILASLAAAIVAVAAGSAAVRIARRRFLAAVAGALGRASQQMRGVYQQAAQRATSSAEASAPRPGTSGGQGPAGPARGQQPGQRAAPGSTVKGAPPGTHTRARHTAEKIVLPDAPTQVAQAVLNAQRDAGQAFDAAMHVALGGKGGPLPPSNPYRDAVDRAMRRLTGIGEDVKDLTGAERAKQSLSRLQAAQHVMDVLASQGLTGFTDKAGRRWELGAYAEMATRTAASRLHLSTQLSMMAQAGNRLVIVDEPGMSPACPRCRPWVGRVLALYGDGSGSSTITDANGTERTEQIAGTLAEAVAAGLMHPQCRHDLVPWTDGAGAVATAAGAPRGYVEHGQPISRQLPNGTPQDYVNEQRLRAHERNVRAAAMRVSAAVTPQAKARAKARLAHARGALEDHVRATGALRQPRREKPGVAR